MLDLTFFGTLRFAVIFSELRVSELTIMKFTVGNEHRFYSVQSHAVPWTNEDQARDTWKTSALFNWFRLKIAMTTV